MKKYYVIQKQQRDDSKVVRNLFSTKEEASDFAISKLTQDKSLTIFDFEIDEVEIDDYPLTHEDACLVLGISTDVGVDNQNNITKSAIAFYLLSVMANAWNKVDNFVPDYTDFNQDKWRPYLSFGDGEWEIEITKTYSIIDAPFQFKDAMTAQKFGDAFIGLIKEMYGVNEK